MLGRGGSHSGLCRPTMTTQVAAGRTIIMDMNEALHCYVVTFVKPQFSGILSEGILREP